MFDEQLCDGEEKSWNKGEFEQFLHGVWRAGKVVDPTFPLGKAGPFLFCGLQR